MAKNVILPALGMAQETGKIVQWLKSEGDQVAQGDPIAEIETDKATVEIEVSRCWLSHAYHRQSRRRYSGRAGNRHDLRPG